MIVSSSELLLNTASTETIAHLLENFSQEQNYKAFDIAITKLSNINYQDSNGKTPLMHAAANGFMHGIERLLQQAADMNLVDKNNCNALMYAAKIPNANCVKALSDATTNLNQQDIDGNSAIHLLINNTYKNVTEDELDEGTGDIQDLYIRQGHFGGNASKPNTTVYNIFLGSRPSDGYNIHEGRTVRLIKFLLEHNANINIQNKNGETALSLSCAAKARYLFNKLAEQPEINWELQDQNGFNILHRTLHWQNKAASELAIAHSPGLLNKQNIAGVTALMYAVLLIGRSGNRIDWQVRDQQGNSAVDWPAKISDEAVQDLVKRGNEIKDQIKGDDKGHKINNIDEFINAVKLTNSCLAIMDKYSAQIDWQITDKKAQSLLHLSAQTNAQNLVEKILVHCPDLLNKQDVRGATALLHAVHLARTGIVELLLDKYKAQDLKDIQGTDAWNIAIQKANMPMVKMMAEKQGIDLKEVELWIAARQGTVEVLKNLLDQQVNPDSTILSFRNTTPLIQGVLSNNAQVVILLLDRGADINKADDAQISPLYYALGKHPINEDIVKMLVDRGADTNQGMYDQDTPLHMALYRSHKNMALYLIEHNANVNTQNDQGQTPLHCLLQENTCPPHDPKTQVLEAVLQQQQYNLTIEDIAGKTIAGYAEKYCPEALPVISDYIKDYCPDALYILGDYNNPNSC